VSQQERRAHLVDGLLVNDPSPKIVKALSLDQDSLSARG
jgi:hypothetical protein